jgi:hypothetical protein
MSSEPTPEKVKELRTALHDYRRLCKRLAELKEAADKIEQVEYQARQLHRDMLKMLEGMDVASNGNMGWESRVIWFLCDLDAQSSTKPLLATLKEN